jgi:subtilisin-like proprotein convertase family protein
MKFKTFAILLVWAAAFTAQADLYNYDYSGVNTIIRDNDTAGLSETHVLSGLNGTITGISVTLDTSGGYNGDLYGYLVSDSGYAVLLNRIGVSGSNPFGSATSGMDVTLASGATDNIQSAGGAAGTELTGIFQADGRTTSPLSVASSDPVTATMDSFIGGDPNGAWTLFLADVSPGGQSTLDSWSMQITTTPEPITVALSGFFGLVLISRLARRGLSWVW